MVAYSREFQYHHDLAKSMTGGVLDIPHLSVLLYDTPSVLVDRFISDWGVKPEAVCLPAVASDGLLFEVQDLPEPASRYATGFAGGIEVWEDVVAAFIGLGLRIYLSIDPTLTFVSTDALHVVDIEGDGAATVCVVNPGGRRLASAILGTAVDKVLNICVELGVQTSMLADLVVDTAEFWPMGGHGSMVSTTCFCDHCRDEIRRRTQISTLFEKLQAPAPNLWNLALRPTASGMDFISDICQDGSPESILASSRQKGFDAELANVPDAELAQMAKTLLEYIRIRHDMTAAAIGELFADALNGLGDLGIARVIIVEGAQLNWTSGLQFGRLDSNAANWMDEVWFDPSSTALTLQRKPYRSYMWRRSRYFIDAFLSFVANVGSTKKRATTGIARLTIEQARARLDERLQKAHGTGVRGKTSLASLPPAAEDGATLGRVGFVGVEIVEGDAARRFIKEHVVIVPGLVDGSPQAHSSLDALLDTIARAQGANAQEE